MNYVTTNIRIPEEDYLSLKIEAAKQRKSLSAVIRTKLNTSGKMHSVAETEKIMLDLDLLAKRNGKKLKGASGMTIIREMRDTSKW